MEKVLPFFRFTAAVRVDLKLDSMLEHANFTASSLPVRLKALSFVPRLIDAASFSRKSVSVSPRRPPLLEEGRRLLPPAGGLSEIALFASRSAATTATLDHDF